MAITTPTTPEQRRLLLEAKFIHVTGLRLIWVEKLYGGSSVAHRKTIEAGEEDLGRWNFQDCMEAIVTPGGEVWLSTTISVLPEDHPLYAEVRKARNETIKQLCPEHQSASPDLTVNYAYRGELHAFDLIARLLNPDYQPQYY